MKGERATLGVFYTRQVGVGEIVDRVCNDVLPIYR